MSDSSSPTNPYTKIIDLTTRALHEEKREQGAVGFAEPDPALPAATIDTLPASVRRALDAAGWASLMPVQEKTLPYLLERRDLIVQSRTGSGKTGAFLLPLFDILDPEKKAVQALILTPTRELARQINEEFERMRGTGDGASALQTALIYGGVRYGPQISALQGGAQVVIGTPGRILDHIERKNLLLQTLDLLILDEADEMLSMGFYPAMRQLKRHLPHERTSYMFSATMPPKVHTLGQEFLDNPGFLGLSAGQESVDTIEHLSYTVSQMGKDRALVSLIEMENPDSAIIFANTKRDVEYLSRFLQNYGHHADEISGDLSQQQREKVMDQIREGKLRFLVATDVAARGIDISDLSHVFMYDIPQDTEYYLHRAGRTGRIGKAGKAIVLVTPVDKNSLLRIARRYGFEIDQHDMPSDEEVRDRISERLTVQLEDRLRERSTLEKERMRWFVPLVEELAREEPELLAMLVDDLYHSILHAPPSKLGEAATQGSGEMASGDAPADDDQDGIAERLMVQLKDRLRGRSNLEKERMRRFVLLVEELAREEPELLAMLVDDLHRGVLPAPPPKVSGGATRGSGGTSRPSRGKSSRSGGKGGRGRGRNRGRRS